jgi:aspartyl protease family protein
MSWFFDPRQGLIVVNAELEGPSGSIVLRLALDTGATGTLVNVSMLAAVGYDPAMAPTRLHVTTGSGVEYVPQVIVSKLMALGEQRINFPVIGHTLPPSATVDGLLGLDFLRQRHLTIDFRDGQIVLT